MQTPSLWCRFLLNKKQSRRWTFSKFNSASADGLTTNSSTRDAQMQRRKRKYQSFIPERLPGRLISSCPWTSSEELGIWCLLILPLTYKNQRCVWSQLFGRIHQIELFPIHVRRNGRFMLPGHMFCCVCFCCACLLCFHLPWFAGGKGLRTQKHTNETEQRSQRGNSIISKENNQTGGGGGGDSWGDDESCLLQKKNYKTPKWVIIQPFLTSHKHFI